MKFAKLLDDAGRSVREPAAVPASVSFDAREGVAQAWNEDGRALVAVMVKVRVVWMGAAGIRGEGMEPFEGPDGTQYRAMEWQQVFLMGKHMSNFKKQVLVHAALLLMMVGCMTVARKPGLELFYFLVGILFMPVFGSMRDLFCTISQRIRNS